MKNNAISTTRTSRRFAVGALAIGAVALCGALVPSAANAAETGGVGGGGIGGEAADFYTLGIHKTDPSGAPLAGATFTVTLDYVDGVAPEAAPVLFDDSAFVGLDVYGVTVNSREEMLEVTTDAGSARGTGAGYDITHTLLGTMTGQREVTVTTDESGNASIYVGAYFDLDQLYATLTLTEVQAPEGFVAAAPAVFDLVAVTAPLESVYPPEVLDGTVGSYDASVTPWLGQSEFERHDWTTGQAHEVAVADRDPSDSVSFAGSRTIDLTSGIWDDSDRLAGYPSEMTALFAEVGSHTAPAAGPSTFTAINQPAALEEPVVPEPQPDPEPEPQPEPEPETQPQPVVTEEPAALSTAATVSSSAKSPADKGAITGGEPVAANGSLMTGLGAAGIATALLAGTGRLLLSRGR